MRALFPSWLLLLLLSLTGRAQTPVLLRPEPLRADPARAASTPTPTHTKASAAQQQLAALALPFFEDFTLPRDGQPSPARWQGRARDYPDGSGGNAQTYGGGGAYVSNRLAVNPLTRGTATLDGLRANGLPYNAVSASSYGATDTLTSLPIDLSGFSAGSQVYLSYALQEGTLAGSPIISGGSTPVGLTLEFLDQSGLWNVVKTYDGAGRTTRFKQQIFPVAAAGYFHAGFRFRFRAAGSQATSRDAFGLDYILLNANRAANDTVFQDIATSRGLSSPLRDFTAMPAGQFAAAGASALSPALNTTINNLASGGNPTPISWLGTARELSTGGGGFGPATWLSGNAPIAAATRQQLIQGDARTAPLPTPGTPRRYRYALALQTNETNPLTLPNDSTYRDLDLTDYYAFDDGSAESFLTLPALSSGPVSYFAYGITLAKNDQVRAVSLAPIFNNIPAAQGGENFQSRSVTVAVWADKNGQPADPPLATATAVLANPLPAGKTFYEVVFATPVAVSGRFYVGYGQVSNGQFLPYGYDLNNAAAAPTLFYNAQGAWSKPALSTPGTIMLRAVMNNNVLAVSAAQTLNASFALYPNPTPAGTTVAVSGPAFGRAALLDVLGRELWQQPIAEAGQPRLRLPASLPGGVYLVRLTLPSGEVATRRLVLE